MKVGPHGGRHGRPRPVEREKLVELLIIFKVLSKPREIENVSTDGRADRRLIESDTTELSLGLL